MSAHDFSGDWKGLKERYEAWWKGENTGGPIIGVIAPRRAIGNERVADRWVESSSEKATKQAVPAAKAHTPEELREMWTDPGIIQAKNLAMFAAAHATGDSYPRISCPLGPASLAAFLGAEPIFTGDTVWYHPMFGDAGEAQLEFDSANPWLRWSLDATKWLREDEQQRYITGIPELCESFDVLGLMFDSRDFLMELCENPEDIHRLLRVVQSAWFEAYDLHHSLLVDSDGYCCYGAFALLGKGKIAKIQCDMSAMISPQMFREFALPYLKEMTERLDRTLYHLDGVSALVHLDDVLSMESLDALQWTPGAGKPDGGDMKWDFIYEKALDAGKRIYALVHPKNLARFVGRFGGKGVYIVTQADGPETADALVKASKELSAGR
jgi:5-methyltetrahydrofolate--homocysteine methyltransferase